MYKKILVPLDGSELAEGAIPHVRTIATGCNVSEVVLLRIIDPSYSFDIGELAASSANLATQVEQQEEKDHNIQAKRYIDKEADKLRKEGIAATGEIMSGITSSKVAEEIIKYAEKNDVDLIIMSTHGRSGISRWALGSTADRVIQHTKVPVLIISPHGCRVASA